MKIVVICWLHSRYIDNNKHEKLSARFIVAAHILLFLHLTGYILL